MQNSTQAVSTNIATEKIEKTDKTQKLILSLVLDGIGFLSYAVPFLGEIIDVAWAPLAALFIVSMYKGTSGKVASIVAFIEELSIVDFIPTFTIMWFYTYIIKKEK